MSKKLPKPSNQNYPSYQSTLTKEQIAEKLEDYREVDNIYEVPIGTHIRYFSTIKDPNSGKSQRLFRMGGFLDAKVESKGYVRIKNSNDRTWSVQVKNAEFWQKLTLDEIRDEYEYELEELEMKYDNLKKKTKELLSQNETLKKENKGLKDELMRYKKKLKK